MASDSTRASDGFPTPADDAELARTATYPHLIIRLMPAVYQREHINVRIGPPAVEIGCRCSFVQHPEPFDADGTISAACRTLLIAGVQDAARRLKFRMCVVWAPASNTYVEADSITNASDHPTGGWSLPAPIQFDKTVWLSPETPGGSPYRVRPWLPADRVIRNERTGPKRAANNCMAAFWWLLLIALGLLLHFF